MRLPPFWTAMPVVLGIVFIGTGTMHFAATDAFAQIVPPAFANPRLLVQISGIAELCGGIGVLVPRVRRAAGLGLIALLLAVFPANVYMAVDAAHFASVGPAWVFWLRLPLQFVLLWFIYRGCIRPHPDVRPQPH